MTAQQAANLIANLRKQGWTRKQVIKFMSTGFQHGRPVSKKAK